MWVGRSCGEQGLTYEPAKPVQVLFTDFPQGVVFRSFFRVEKKKMQLFQQYEILGRKKEASIQYNR
jgi:hypothetical protein